MPDRRLRSIAADLALFRADIKRELAGENPKLSTAALERMGGAIAAGLLAARRLHQLGLANRSQQPNGVDLAIPTKNIIAASGEFAGGP